MQAGCKPRSRLVTRLIFKLGFIFFRQKTQKKQKPKVPESLLKKRKQNEESRARHLKSNLLAKKVIAVGLLIKGAGARQNQQNDVCVEQRLGSSWASAQSDLTEQR